MRSWNSGAAVNDEQIATIRQLAVAKDYFGTVDSENASIVADHILYNEVIGKRCAHLDMIKKGFEETPIYGFLQQYPYLIDAVFPRDASFNYPPAMVIAKIDCDSSSPLVQAVKDFII